MTQTLSITDGRSVLRMERHLGHPPERVWPALVEPARLAEWFPAEVEIGTGAEIGTRTEVELRAGGALSFRQDGAPAARGVVTDLDPPRLFAFTWGDDHLRFELRADGPGSLLVLTHTFDDRAGAASFAAGWHTCIAALDLALAGRPGADPGVDHRALHERYLAELGLVDGTATTTAAGWEVRVERQLLRPAEDVWAALAAAGPLRVGAPSPAVWPGAGAITEVREPTLLEHEVATGGRVRWELRPGTGHGARLLLVRSAPVDAQEDRADALAQAPSHVAALLEAVR